MWCSDRRMVMAGLVALAGCGFRPVHAPGGTGTALMGQVRARDPATRAEFRFLQAFEDRLGRPAPGRFGMDYSLSVTRGAGASIDALGVTAITLRGFLGYTLTEGGTTRASGQVVAETWYSTTATQFATQTAEDDAEARLVRMLADAVVARLLADPALAA
jgi:LPS-assembly lipoprotein